MPIVHDVGLTVSSTIMAVHYRIRSFQWFWPPQAPNNQLQRATKRPGSYTKWPRASSPQHHPRICTAAGSGHEFRGGEKPSQTARQVGRPELLVLSSPLNCCLHWPTHWAGRSPRPELTCPSSKRRRHAVGLWVSLARPRRGYGRLRPLHLGANGHTNITSIWAMTYKPLKVHGSACWLSVQRKRCNERLAVAFE